MSTSPIDEGILADILHHRGMDWLLDALVKHLDRPGAENYETRLRDGLERVGKAYRLRHVDPEEEREASRERCRAEAIEAFRLAIDGLDGNTESDDLVDALLLVAASNVVADNQAYACTTSAEFFAERFLQQVRMMRSMAGLHRTEGEA